MSVFLYVYEILFLIIGSFNLYIFDSFLLIIYGVSIMFPIKSVFNKEFPLGPGFIYDDYSLVDEKARITIKPRKNSKAKCCVCGNS